MGLVDRLKAAVTPVPEALDGEDDLFTDVDDDTPGDDGDDNSAENQSEEV